MKVTLSKCFDVFYALCVTYLLNRDGTPETGVLTKEISRQTKMEVRAGCKSLSDSKTQQQNMVLEQIVAMLQGVYQNRN